MKTTFKQFLKEATVPAAASAEDLLDSIKDGKFTKDGSKLKVEGNFNCKNSRLTSLEGAPTHVGGRLDCYFNLLTSLEGAPKFIGSNFFCAKNKLSSLKGAPDSVPGIFDCRNNLLTSLEDAPTEVGGDFYCDNNKLTSLEGAPVIVGRSFDCDDNQLTSLEGVHKQIKEIGDRASFEGNKIKSHVLGLLKIKKLKMVVLDNKEIGAIINKYLPEGDIFACQQELIDAGYDAYAQL